MVIRMAAMMQGFGVLQNPLVNAVDNCGVDASTGIRSDAWINYPYPEGTTTITWKVTDIHGNAAILVTQTVTVTDK